MGRKMIFHVRDYRDGITEVTWNTDIRPERPEKAERGKSENLEENRMRSICRAKKTITRKLLWNNLDHLLTLTYRENMQDIERARADREKFCNEVQKRIPGWKYLGVYETQRRGAYHSHLSVEGRQNVNILREVWWGIVGAGGGNANVKEPKRGKGNTRMAMARYMGKYLSKSTDGDNWELNRKIYFHSKNVQDPPVEKINVEYMGGANEAEMAAIILDTRGGKLVSLWESIDGRKGRVASFSYNGGDTANIGIHLMGEPHPLWTKAAREGFCCIAVRPGENTCCGGENSIT